VKLTLLFEFDEETQYIVVTCSELGVSTCGKNMSDAFDMIGDALATYWSVLEELDEYEPGEGISVLETHVRMREEGKL